MDGSTQALLSIIISGTALIISVLSVLRTRKNHLSGILSSQRLVWAENLRIAVSAFITAIPRTCVSLPISQQFEAQAAN